MAMPARGRLKRPCPIQHIRAPSLSSQGSHRKQRQDSPWSSEDLDSWLTRRRPTDDSPSSHSTL